MYLFLHLYIAYHSLYCSPLHVQHKNTKMLKEYILLHGLVRQVYTLG